MGKSVLFAGHREDWRNTGVEDKLYRAIEELISNDCDIFYTGACGYFDAICEKVVRQLKSKYPFIKLIRVDYQYSAREEEQFYDERYVFEFENIYYKRRITERNKYLVDKCDILLCNIYQSYKSGAYSTYLYALKSGKIIINLHDNQ